MEALLRPDLDRLARALPPRPRTRYAPSPTGYLHLGHVVNAIYVWGIARALDGHVLVRIEDHDRIRSRPEYDAALIEDLAWLGFAGDEPIRRQHDEEWAYEDALHALARSHHVYACDCSRRDIAAAADRAGEEVRYTGRQIRLSRMLGRLSPPTFAHHPILRKPSGEKLSKSSGDTGVRALRAAGVSAAEVIGRAAAAVGLLEMARPLAATEVQNLFRPV